MTQIPPNMPRKNSRALTLFGKLLSSLQRWQLVGEPADEPKLILALAPHTSNWDFFIGVPMMFALDAKLSVMMKREAFFWPFTGFLKFIGFIPVNRQAANGIVDEAAKQFDQHEGFWLVLTPEGTRKNVRKWKSGFLRIARQADVPVQLVSLDYANKRCHFGPVFKASDNIEKDLAFCVEYASQFTGRR